MCGKFEENAVKNAAAEKAEQIMNVVVADCGAVPKWQQLQMTRALYVAIMVDVTSQAIADFAKQEQLVRGMNSVRVDILVMGNPDRMVTRMVRDEWPHVMEVLNAWYR